MHHQATQSPIWAIESNSISNSEPLWVRRAGTYFCGGSLGRYPTNGLTLHNLCRTLHRVIPTRPRTSPNFLPGLINLLAPAAIRGIERALGMVVKKRVMQELLTLKEVERELKISRTTVWRLRKLGLIKTSAFGGIIRVHRRDLERFVANELMAGRSR
jgi:hypothetical protein